MPRLERGSSSQRVERRDSAAPYSRRSSSSTGLTKYVAESSLNWEEERSGARSWRPPTDREQLIAALDASALPPGSSHGPGCERCVFAVSAAFHLKLPPRRDDWLADGQPGVEEREGQPFSKFLIDVGLGSRASARRAAMYMPSAARHAIYLASVDGGDAVQPLLQLVADFVSRWFCLPCRLLGSVPPPAELVWRGTGQSRQLDSAAVLEFYAAERQRLPDAFAVLAVTAHDLTTAGLNFVFGEADVRRGAGVFSLARYHPEWGRKGASASASAVAAAARASPRYVRRCCQLVVHELGHLFQFEHCVHWECVMNGANHLDEFDAQPLLLCPADLRKLATAVNHAVGGFAPIARYRRLLEFYHEHGFATEATWVDARLQELRAAACTGPRCEPCPG